MYLKIKIYSKTKTSLNNFLIFFSTYNHSTQLVRVLPSIKKKKFLSVLKSPHVNKNAQDQFELIFFCRTLFVYSSQPKLFILIFKKFINSSFPDLKIKIYNSIGNNKFNLFFNNIFTVKNVNINFVHYFKNYRVSNYKTIDKYLTLCDCYGEQIFKKLS